MTNQQPPELLAPAGNYEKAMVAFHYGADAVYVGVSLFGLRKYADNLSLDELSQLVAFANQEGKQVYVVLNAFAHNEDIRALRSFLPSLEAIAPHAVIVSDYGVARLITDTTSLPLHVSTQASVTHAMGCAFWKELGAKRVILAREVSLEACKAIQAEVDIELEVFIHGAMCASYSGKCVISNYTAGRDSNRGGCVQSCRHRYRLSDPKNPHAQHSTHIMNAKDLQGILQIPAVLDAGIASLKIEGRMKSNIYVANSVAAYRHAIDYCVQMRQSGQAINTATLRSFQAPLSDVSNRSFSAGGLQQRPAGDSIHYDFEGYHKTVHYIGRVHQLDRHGYAVCDVKQSFNADDRLGVLCIHTKKLAPLHLHALYTVAGDTCTRAHPNSVVKLDSHTPLAPQSLVVLYA